MIDIEPTIFNIVATALRAEFDDVFVSGENIAAPPSFPAVSIAEQDNSVYTRTMDLAGNENHAQLMYEVNVYSNLTAGRKSQCKMIMTAIDDEMNKVGFGRISCSPTPNINPEIYRMTARYRAVADKNKHIQKIV